MPTLGLVTKANGTLDCQGIGVSLHTVGSISISQHKENLVNVFSDLCTFEILLHKYYFNLVI